MDIDKEREKTLIKRYLLSSVFRAVFAAVILTLAFTFLFGIVILEDSNMFPQIHAGDMAVFFRPGSIGNQDAVLYRCRDGVSAGRIVACPGDEIGVTGSGLLVINGNMQPVQKRIGIFDETEQREDGISYPLTLGDDEYFILGDDRGEARDSRVYGSIRKKDIEGVIFILIRRRSV